MLLYPYNSTAQNANACARFNTKVLYPILDSFPHIYYPSESLASVSVSTSLSTNTSVALRIKNLRTIVSRSIGLDEREALSNSLGEIAEAYEEGWDSGSDSDNDD